MSRSSKPDPKGAMIPGSQAAPKHLIHTVSQLGKPGSQWSFGKRLSKIAASKTPGPDHYSIASSIGTGPTHVMGQRLADQSQKSHRENPGPAAYQTTDSSRIRVGTAPSYTLSGRPSASKPNEYPGPDRYRPHTAPSNGGSGGGCSLSGRPKEPARLSTPGPGAYQPAKEATLPTSASYSLRSRTSKGSQRKGAATSVQGSPGPAAYNIGEACPHKKRNPAFSMGARLRGVKCDSTPSPHAYYIRSPIGQKKSW